MTNVDVTRDICRERDLVKQKSGNNRSFVKGDYMIKTHSQSILFFFSCYASIQAFE